MREVILVCGVSGSGKTWVCNQLKDKYHYIPNDSYIGSRETYQHALWMNARMDDGKKILADNPFGERELKEYLELKGIKVTAYFIIEPPDVCASRYFKREGKPIQKSALTRAITIRDRAIEWGAKLGTSQQILEMLK